MFGKNCSLFLIFAVFSFTWTCSASLKPHIASYLPICKRHQSDFNQCMRTAFEIIREHLPKGVPEMLIPPLEPLKVTEIILDTGNTFKAIFSNLEIFHGSEYIVERVDVDVDANRVNLDLFFPLFLMRGDYKLTGKILILELNGQDTAEANITNVKTLIRMNGFREMRQGKEYINFDKKNITIDVGPSTFHFNNIFKGNEELTMTTNKVINDNIADIIDELKPVLEDTIAQVTFGITDRVFKTFTVDQLFPN